MLGTLEEILPSLQDDIKVWLMTKESTLPRVDTILDKLDGASDDPIPDNLCFAKSLKDPLLYIFTSGTTGTTFDKMTQIWIVQTINETEGNVLFLMSTQRPVHIKCGLNKCTGKEIEPCPLVLSMHIQCNLPGYS